MALVPEIIYDDIVETLRGKTRNYRGGSDYLLNFHLLIDTDRIFEIGDIIEIQFGNNTTKVEVLELKESTKKEDAAGMYRSV